MAIIPARLGSTRIKNKPLQEINGIPLIKLVALNVEKTGLFSKVVVATDATEIMDLFKGSDIKAVMTGVHESGTDRVHEAMSSFLDTESVVLNIQGDEPFIYKEDLAKLIKALEEGYNMTSLYEEISREDIKNPNKVKVILDKKTNAIYFSRFPVPFSRNGEETREFNKKNIGKHIGVYGYRTDFLNKFCNEGVSFLESNEKLEQLRALEMGEKIKMVFTKNSYKGVDTVDDIKEVEEILNKKKSGA